MTPDAEANELVGRVADDSLLGDGAKLPLAVGRPEPIPPSRARGRLVGVGATLTGVTLILGVGLAVFAAIELILGGVHLLGIGALALGLGLAGTHWGWVHIAEATADAIEGRQRSEITSRRHRWLQTISPYTRYEVTTDVGDDGSITICRIAYRPVRTGAHAFTFSREVEREERHPGEETAAAVAERAELLRREAARDTERERGRFEAAASTYGARLLHESDEQQRLDALRAESEALSEQINSKLRDPPLTE